MVKNKKFVTEQFKVFPDGIYRDVSICGDGTMMLVIPKDIFKQAYEEYICGDKAINLKNAPLSKIQADAFDIQYKKLNEELEETVRGDLMNLKLIKKHLDEVRPTAKTKNEYLRVMKFIDMDISNLDKFVEERWGHDED